MSGYGFYSSTPTSIRRTPSSLFRWGRNILVAAGLVILLAVLAL